MHKTKALIPFMLMFSVILLPIQVVNADKPAIVETYINPTTLIQIVTQEFGEIVANEVTEIIPKYLRPQMLNHPYGLAFKALTDAAVLGEILKPALLSAGPENGYSKYSKLLTAINKAPVFREMAHTRQYSGCLSVFLHLKTYTGGIVVMKTSKANPYEGCKNNKKYHQTSEIFYYPSGFRPKGNYFGSTTVFE